MEGYNIAKIWKYFTYDSRKREVPVNPYQQYILLHKTNNTSHGENYLFGTADK